jgi:hypothetical protein
MTGSRRAYVVSRRSDDIVLRIVEMRCLWFVSNTTRPRDTPQAPPELIDQQPGALHRGSALTQTTAPLSVWVR